MKTETAHAFAQPGSMDAPRAAAAGGRGDFQHLLSMACARAARGDEASELSRGFRDDPERGGKCSRAHDRGHRRAVIVDFRKDPRLGRIFLNRTIKALSLPVGSLRHGRHDPQRVVSFPTRCARARAWKQILYLLGPVGGSRCSLAERLKALIETQPIYVLAAERS